MNGSGNLEIVSNNNLLEVRLGTSVFRSSKKENYEEFSHAQIISVLKGIQEIYKVDKTKRVAKKLRNPLKSEGNKETYFPFLFLHKNYHNE